MNTYLAIITTALVITQVIRLVQNTIQLRNQKTLYEKQLKELADMELTEKDFEIQKKFYRLGVECFELFHTFFNKKAAEAIVNGGKPAMNPIEIKPLVCERCGGHIDRQTMKCPYCDTQYERKNNGVTVNYVVNRPGVHTLRADIRVDNFMVLRDPEGATEYALDRLRHEIADGLLAYMKITTSKELSFHNECEIIRGEVRVIDPTFTNY